MKITGVRAHVLEAKLAEPFAYSRMWYAKRMSMIVEIVTDEGLTGWGECYGPAWINAAVVRELGSFLIGHDPVRGEFPWHELYARYRDHGQKGVVIQGLSGIDIALWDLRGKFFGQPIHRLMGGPVREEVKAYATGLYRRESPDHTVYLCEEALESRPRALTKASMLSWFMAYLIAHRPIQPSAGSDSFSSFCRLFRFAGLGLLGNAEGHEATTTSPT
jgi:D-galactarolactone cycloisomerase